MSAPLTCRTRLRTGAAAVTPVTGRWPRVGQYGRIAAQIVTGDINTAGRIASMGGGRLELLLGDSESTDGRGALRGRSRHRRPAPTAMIRILKRRPRIVWPLAAAEEKLVFPRPKR